MQATQTTRRLDHGQIKKVVLAIALLGSLTIGAAALALTDQLPVIGGSESRAVTAPQITSDELYALKAGLGNDQVDGWQATVAQMTSDELFALEAQLVAAAATDRHTRMMQLTPDEAYAIEQALLLVGSPEQQAGR